MTVTKAAPATYPFLTRKQVHARIESEPAFMGTCARILQTRTEQRSAGTAPPGTPWGWMSSERVVAGRLVEKMSVGMLSVDDEAKLAKLVSRYSRQLADHYRTIALVENPELSAAAVKFGVLPTGFDPASVALPHAESEEVAGQYPLEEDYQAEERGLDQDDELAPRVIAHAERSPGQRTDEIAKAMGTTTAMLSPALRMLVHAKKLRKQGIGRGTRYFCR